MISDIEFYYEPIHILNEISGEYATEMSNDQLAFLCGLLKKYTPEKIVEIGVAAGGTTAVMLNCIDMLDMPSQLFSIDLAEDFYRDSSKKTGYLADRFRTISNKTFDYVLYIGKYAVECVDDIGKYIDFLILDTVHSLPGELLDFLAYLPYLKEGCVVVLHDTALNHYSDNKDAFATRILFSSVMASKILYKDASMAAFVVTGDTKKSIDNIFSVLMVTWNYLPSHREISLYKNIYSKYYTDENLEIFDLAVSLNQKSIERNIDIKLSNFLKVYKLINTMQIKQVYIYGFGNYGKQFYSIFEKCGINLGGYIISDNQRLEKENKKIYFLSDIVFNKESDLIFVGVNPSLWKEIEFELQKKKLTNYIFPDVCMFEYLKKV